MTRRTAFWVLVALQALVPVAMAGLRQADVSFGQHVLLEVESVDPRDPFRGQYVALRYPIGSVYFPAGATTGTTVYVPLHREGEVWRGSAATTTQPDGGTYIRGQVRGGQIEFGIEQYYADEDEARRLGLALRERGTYADVALGPDGRATLTRLVVR
ncbi:MAG TPA: GDYXXLXY domain-containing protein [Gaiellaceae bacterium]|nr:GDYXXLXY domain-containing protein [Gaiellaceae bacterium]